MGIVREVYQHLSWQIGFGHATSGRPHKCPWCADGMVYGVGYIEGKDVKLPNGISPAELEKMVAGSTIWIQAPDARRTLWNFAAALLDNERLIELCARIEDKEEWDVLRRTLKAEAEQRRLPAARKLATEPT